MKSFYRTVLLTLILVLAQSCSDDGSAEDQIRHLIDNAVQSAEDRSVDGLGELMHSDFIDQKGNNRTQLSKLLRLYFFRHKNIHLFTRVDSIEILSDNQASVSLHVAMAGSVISDVDALSSLSARIYRFELQLVKQDDWLLRHASWMPASLGAFD